MAVTHKQTTGSKAVETIEENTTAKEEIMLRGIEDFSEVQQNMIPAKEENAPKTYANLKRKYISLKTLLQSLGVNMTSQRCGINGEYSA